MATTHGRGPRATILAAVGLAAAAAMSPPAQAFTSSMVDARGPALAWGKAVGDLDGDGRQDLMVGGYAARDGGLYWYQNPGWRKHTISPTARISTDLEVVDLDRDGKLDLVGRAYGRTGGTLHIWRQASLASWPLTPIATGTAGEGLLATDLDRDGRVDVTVGTYWFANRSTPGRLALVRHRLNPAAATYAYVAAGDVNGDGRVDVVTAPSEKAGQRYRVSWFEAPFDPAAGAAWREHVIESTVEAVVHFVGVADFTGDGRPDVATAMMQQGTNPKIKLYANRGGAFGAPEIIAATSSHSMKILEVNGRKALVGADWNRSPVTPVRLFR